MVLYQQFRVGTYFEPFIVSKVVNAQIHGTVWDSRGKRIAEAMEDNCQYE